MSQLDVWLFDNYQISRADLVLNIEKIAANASRYSKEHTLPAEEPEVDKSAGIGMALAAAIENFTERWIDEVERSAEEDRQGTYRRGENMQVANAMAEANAVLRKLGSKATLDAFPFEQIPEEVAQFFARAVQKAIGSALRKLGKVDLFQDAMVYCDKELRGILEMEF